jgi:TIR domain
MSEVLGMSDQASLRALSARVDGLRQAMEAVMHGTAPDIGKWSAAPSYARTYSELAGQYLAISGDDAIHVYDTTKLRSAGSMTWPEQKSLFDRIYADTLMLSNVLTQSKLEAAGPMFNLLVSGLEDAWTGAPFQIELSRCVREYTAPNITSRYAKLDKDAVSELKKLPCIFAYESGLKLPPKFGFIRDIIHRQGQVRIQYEIHVVEPFLSASNLEEMTFELDIGKLELYRTHWAVKEVNLPKELHSRGINLPLSMRDVANAVDISKHNFDIALSFPGETRALVEQIAQELERRLGPNSYFYDRNYVSQLAQPSLDTLLQGIYRRAKLDVVFLSTDYQKKDWCGVEFRAVRDTIFSRENSRVMFVRTDDGLVDGVFQTDGYLDAREFIPSEIADFICERLQVLVQDNASPES